MVGMGGGLGFGVGGGGGGGGGLAWRPSRVPSNFHRSNASASGSDAAMDAENQNGAQSKPSKARFPLKAALTASVLATTGDTVAQLYDRYKKQKAVEKQAAVEVVELPPGRLQQATEDASLWNHDWQRAARMASYGFLIYGPLSQVWYEILDHFLPLKNMTNLSIKVAANQLILGPIVITLVFAWNKLWEGHLEQLPNLYRTRALPTLIDGWKFWLPASVLNFGVIPLQARVAFMSSCSIFWNFYLSNTMTAAKAKAITAGKAD